MLSAVELEGGLCLVSATHRGVMLCRYYADYEARDALRSYADITTKLATRRELFMPILLRSSRRAGSYADITTKLATQCGVMPILATTKHITLYMV